MSATQVCEYLSVWTGIPESWKFSSKYQPMWLSTLTGEGRRADFIFRFLGFLESTVHVYYSVPELL